MALDPDRLSTAYQFAFVLAGAIPGPPLKNLCDGLAGAIVDELKDHAELNIDIGPPPTGTIE